MCFSYLKYITVFLANLICVEGDYLSDGSLNWRLVGYTIESVRPVGVLGCVKLCSAKGTCFSINYNRDQLLCEMLSISVQGTSQLTSDSGYVYITNILLKDKVQCLETSHCSSGNECVSLSSGATTCIRTSCEINNTVTPNISLPVDVFASSVGTNLTCKSRPDLFTTCRSDGKWSVPLESVCGFSSCREVKQCDTTATDGEYWLYLGDTGNKTTVKIYCNNMSTPESATEYLTLPGNTNYITKHDLSHTVNQKECTRNSKPLLKVTFSKVRLNIDTMEIVQKDYNFTELSGLTDVSTIGIGFGVAADCSGHSWSSPCTRYGALSIDLRGTGFIIDPLVIWQKGGYASKLQQYTRQSDQVYCLAGGWCGSCKPNRDIRLISQDSAVTGDVNSVSCH